MVVMTLLPGVCIFFLRGVVVSAVDDNSTADTHTSTTNAAGTGGGECGIWMGLSTIPGAGLGMFNGGQALPKNAEYGLDQDQVGIPMVDVEFMNGYFEANDSDVSRINWQDYLMNMFISPADFGLDHHYSPDTHFSIPGTGALVNCHFLLNNLKEPEELLVDDSSAYHRSSPTSPGVGAFSYIHGYHCPTIQPITPYAELFGSYGENWFEQRRKVIGIVPFKSDWKSAQGFLNQVQYAYQQQEQQHQQQTKNVRDHKEPSTFWADFWRILQKRNENDFQNGVKELLKDLFGGDGVPPSSAFTKEVGELISAAATLKVAELEALPSTWEDVLTVLKKHNGSLYQYELSKSTRSLEYLQEHGRCMDDMVPGNSSIPHAGRGAFARHNFTNGQIVAHAPLLHIVDRSILNYYRIQLVENPKTGELKEQADRDHGPQGSQLLLNYCFGRSSDSSLLLCPYGSSTPYVNHNSEAPNVKIVWAKDTAWFDSECLTLTPVELAGRTSTCLAVDYIALRDIQAGEEIVMDYGTDWQRAWNQHIHQWRPAQNQDGVRYRRAMEWDQDLQTPIPTIKEQVFSGNVVVECRHPRKRKWYPCTILERIPIAEKILSKHGYMYNVLLHLDDKEEEQDLRADNRMRSRIRFADEWYSGDEFLLNAFRHEIGLPDELFSESWISTTPLSFENDVEEKKPNESSEQPSGASSETCNATETTIPSDFVHSPRLKPGEIETIRWSDTNKTVNPYSLRVGLDPMVSRELLAYATKLGIVDMYWDLLQRKKPMKPGSHEMFRFDPEDNELLYYVNRPSKEWKSNMHWANAANEHTHEEYLKVLARGNFDVTLDAIGRYFHLDGIMIQGVCFIGVSHCEKGYIHNDMTGTEGKFFNILFPLVLVENAPPELILRDDYTGREGLAKYLPNEAMVVGDDAYHGTASCDYQRDTELQGIRITASIYIADVNVQNVNEIMADDTTIFPVPEHEEWYTASRGRHWKPSTDAATSRPSLKNDPGRKPIAVHDGWSNCTELASGGACDRDIWKMRANCLKTCRVLIQ